jgi:hypothetical protein
MQTQTVAVVSTAVAYKRMLRTRYAEGLLT